MAADVVHVVLGVPNLVSNALFALALAGLFIGWYRSEKRLSIHSIFTFRREAFYWAAVFATFALGRRRRDDVPGEVKARGERQAFSSR